MLLYNSASDDELVSALRDGDHSAFTEIYNRYWKKLLGVAYRHTRDKPLSEEIVQDIFGSLWLRRDRLEIKSLAAYLATSIKFAVFKTIYRQRRRNEIKALFKYVEESSISEEQIEARFTFEYINGLVEDLPEKCQLVFKYSRFNDMSIPEISKKMGIAEKTVEAQLNKGLKIMRLNLRNFGLFTLIKYSSILMILNHL